MKKSMGMVSAIVVTLAMLVVPAHATPVLNFVISGGGFVEETGGPTLMGWGIGVSGVTGVDTPLNSGVTVNIIGSALDFNTSFSTEETDTYITYGGPGDGISLTGGVDFNNDGDVTDPGEIALGSVLFSGFFGSVTMTPLGNSQYSITGVFTDTKNPDLAGFFGLPSGGYSGTFSLNFSYEGTLPRGYKSREVGEGYVTNTPVPEPGSLILLGSGLIAAFGFARYRKNR